MQYREPVDRVEEDPRHACSSRRQTAKQLSGFCQECPAYVYLLGLQEAALELYEKEE